MYLPSPPLRSIGIVTLSICVCMLVCASVSAEPQLQAALVSAVLYSFVLFLCCLVLVSVFKQMVLLSGVPVSFPLRPGLTQR